MINIGAEDYNVLKQQYIKKYIRLELLDFQYNIVDELSGNMTKCSINVDSNSDLRRSCDLSFVVTTSTFDIKSGQKLWLDKFVRPYVGYENMRTGEIQWYNQGIYLVNNPQWSYNASTNEISMQALDLMSKLTGLRNGNLESIPTKIAKDENVREAIISTLALGGFTKYVCEECKTKDGTIVPVPYDIEIDVGGTVYDVLSSLRDIMPNYQIYFDVNGVFHYEPIPLAYDDPVLIDDDLWPSLLISENINTDFESVKNYVEVLGHTWDVDYYSPSESTTVTGGTITPTFADLKELRNDMAVGIMLPVDASSTAQVFPEEYTQVEYIQSSGTQYIDTGFKPGGNTKVVIDFYAYNQSTAQQGVFGGRTNTTGGLFSLLTGTSTSSLQADYDTMQSLANINNTISELDLTKRVVISMSNELVINSSSVTSVDIKTFTSTQNMYLFANNNGGTLQLPSSLYLYSCMIYDNNTLVRNFIPCKNSAGTVGLYDATNGVFYQNAGSGLFTAGPDVTYTDGVVINYFGSNKVVDINDEPVKELAKDTEWIFQAVAEIEESKLPEGYTQLEYIQSSGTQWIDTGFKPNQNTRVLADCDLMSGVYPTAFGAWSSSSGAKYILLSLSDTVARYYYNLIETDKNVAIKGRHTLDMNKNKLIVDNVEIVTVAASTFSVSQSLYLFTFHGGETTENFKTNAKYYSCKIYDNDTLVRDFIPCKNADGVIGMYDVVNSQFYQNAGIGVFTAGGEVQPKQQMKFWRFMGHQQAQALSYDNNPSSPFYVGDPIGSSSVGRIRIVLYGGEYDNIYSDDLAQQRADFEIYQRSRLNDSISMETIPIPWMDANIVISHRFGQKQEPSKYIVKSFSVDYATGGTMTINAITWYPYYEESEVV